MGLARQQHRTAIASAASRCAVSSDGGKTSMESRRAWASQILEPVNDYPDQLALVRALSAGKSSVAAHGTRRSGKTDAIMRWCAAACTARDRFTVKIYTQTLEAPTKNFFRRRSDGGLLRIFEKLGMLHGVVKVAMAGNPPSVKMISWPEWGSSIIVEDIGTPRAIANKHGGSADVSWIDELTKTPLAAFAIQNLIAPTFADSHGIVILSYTPDEHVDSLAGLIAAGEDTGYDGHWFRSWRNPFFGATFEERRETLVDGIETARGDYMLSREDVARLRTLSEEDFDAISRGRVRSELSDWVDGLHPELKINWFGMWLRLAGSYVYYPFHKLPPETLYWCAVDAEHSQSGRIPVATTWAERVALLPTWEFVEPPEWRIVIAVDIGHDPSKYAEVVKLYAPHYPTIFELHSWTAKKLDDDVMFKRLCDLVRRARALRINDREVPIHRIVADLTGMMIPVQKGWHRRLIKRYPELSGVGVRAPKKTPLVARRIAHNLDLSNGRMQYVAGSPIDFESRHLRYRKDKPAEIDLRREVRVGGKVDNPRNDAITAGRYADMEIPNLNPGPPPGARRRETPVYA